MEEFSRSELYYLGGLFDGEGSFEINVQKDDRRTIGYYVMPKIRIGMKTEDGENKTRKLVKDFFSEVGSEGSAYISNNGVWQHTCAGNNALKCARELKPYLKIKQRQVELLLEPNWENVTESKSEFIKAMKAREKLRNRQKKSSTKYDIQFFKDIWGL